MAEQLAYPSATLESTRGGAGGWFIVDPLLQATQEHEVLNDLDDATYVESDGTWSGARPFFICPVQTLAGKLPLRRPWLGSSIFRFRLRYRIVGGGSFTQGFTIDCLDYVSDHVNITPTLPFPGRRTILLTETPALVGGGAVQEVEITLPAYMLKGHDGPAGTVGWRATSEVPKTAHSGLGFACYAPSGPTGGSPKVQILGCWYRVDEVERYESVGPDWIVKRTPSWRSIDVKGNWAATAGGGTPGQAFSTLFDNGTAITSGQLAYTDACRRAGMTKQFSGTAIVQFDPDVFTGAQSDVANQPNIAGQGVTFGKDSTFLPYIYWRAGLPTAPGALVPVSDIVIRTPPVPDGYRDGNNRASILSPVIGYEYDGVFVEHGRISFYGIRLWCEGGNMSISSEHASGKPDTVTVLDLHDVQITGSIKPGGHEYIWGLRLGGMRHDFRKVVFGRAGEHAIYLAAPTGDAQIVQCENLSATVFYPKHTGAGAPYLPNSFHQFVMRTTACNNIPGANSPNCSPQGSGVSLVEECISRSTGGTDFKCAHTLGRVINRRCKTFAAPPKPSGQAESERAIQYTVESFANQSQSTVPFGVDYSIGSYDCPNVLPCSKHGGSGLPNPAQPYPTKVPGNGKKVFCFKQVIIEDLEVNGVYGGNVVEISGAEEWIIDRGVFNTAKRPIFGFWAWGWDSGNELSSWLHGGAGAFDNVRGYFRNIGTNPHNYYNPGTGTNNGVSVSRLAAYGARSNPNKPGGITPTKGNVAHLTIAQLNLLVGPGNSGYAPWPQTQKVDPGGQGQNLGNGWVYPCMTAPDFDDPAIYGSYLALGRRYPNKNTIDAAVVLGLGFPSPTVTIGGEPGIINVTAGDPSLLLQLEFPSPSVTLPTEVSAGSTPLLLGLEFGDPTVVTAQDVTAGAVPLLLALSFGEPTVTVTVGSVEQIDFSLVPAILGLLLQEPDVVTDATALFGDTLTGATAVCGAVDGGAS